MISIDPDGNITRLDKLSKDELLLMYEQKLKIHDWFYESSEDGVRYKKGKQCYNQLLEIRFYLNEIGAEAQALQLYVKYCPL
jgi:hypothetical protein